MKLQTTALILSAAALVITSTKSAQAGEVKTVSSRIYACATSADGWNVRSYHDRSVVNVLRKGECLSVLSINVDREIEVRLENGRRGILFPDAFEWQQAIRAFDWIRKY
jgi:hypothetical protein